MVRVGLSGKASSRMVLPPGTPADSFQALEQPLALPSAPLRLPWGVLGLAEAARKQLITGTSSQQENSLGQGLAHTIRGSNWGPLCVLVLTCTLPPPCGSLSQYCQDSQYI